MSKQRVPTRGHDGSTAPALVSPTPATRRPWLATYAAQLALGAYGGAIALAVGFLRLPDELEHRLPFGSPLFGALPLTIWVAVPATAVMVMAWRGHPHVLRVAALDGMLLIGSIAVELAFIREFSPLHAFYLAVGAGLTAWGRVAGGRLPRSFRHPDHGRSASANGPS